ncbi:dihydroorotate dehydrogenase (fumarate) [Kwoniella heveanensis BCC8398]|uniref:Dihydroorotate dehydrogenase (quinone), mitochondrial n=1 Tax=Kwoniella heveanensis BCC8398 TaxID=1296120 RepID=A0A1B9GQE7_9TREE|nr:dihydroorotate dehydrogenase (fumarate) [Kwoniella heveanensis BCC8398]
MTRLSSPLSALRRPLPSSVLVQARTRSFAVPKPRFASTSSSSPTPSRRYVSTTLLIGGSVLLVAYYYDSRSLLHEHVVMPLVRYALDPEEGHKLAVRVLGWDKWARPRDMGVDGPELQAELFGLPIKNPVGIAAGFDKDADAIDGLFDLGFGYVEVGSVTPEPQPGNPKPRFFRLEEDDAAINRYGFNSLGHGHTLARLRARLYAFAQSHPSLFPSPLPLNPLPPSGIPRSLRPGQLLAVNLGKNKISAADSNEDYIKGVRLLGPYADVVVVNVSSPNTPGLRALQGRQVLEKLLRDVVEERNRISTADGLPKIAVKVASDLSEEELADVASAVRSSGVEGVIVSNTTIRRQELGLASANQDEVGGLSGKPLFPYALNALKTLRPLLPPSIPLIGCGGVSTGFDALAMARAGASLVQVYTTFGYRGVGTPRLIKDEITSELNNPASSATGILSAKASWKGEVGKDWASSSSDGSSTMGWDERRVAQESEAVKKEAQGLGELLRQLDDREGLATLTREAEQALREIRQDVSETAASGTTQSGSAKVQGQGAEGGARDNLVGASTETSGDNGDANAVIGGGDVAAGLIEAGTGASSASASASPASSVPSNEASGLIASPSSQASQQSQISALEQGSSDIGAPSIQEALLSTPVAIDLTPQVVVENPAAVQAAQAQEVPREVGGDDEWTQSVRSGQRRLV